jgi:hypothetical protein
MVTKTSPDSKLSPRIQRLKSRFIPKSYRSTIKWHPELGEREDVNSAYRPGINLCLERPRLYTEAYKASASDPTIIRRAKALANVLENMTVWIQPDELIVGNYASTPNSLTWHPEYAWRWLTKAIKEGYKDLLDDEGKAEVEAIGNTGEANRFRVRKDNISPQTLCRTGPIMEQVFIHIRPNPVLRITINSLRSALKG